ncbi:MAG TPA: 4a-hydroxytetrahydrobiopterin dehydratase [Gemmatimonadaceae bacterium]|nr:4a-hydroxytetrahydrobiopterin dehydratase [Gemmatimonadaceae bacterium]
MPLTPAQRRLRDGRVAPTRLVAERLSDIGIQRELGGLPGWARRGNALTKTFRAVTFPAGITFVTRVADVAESMDHHPDIDIRHTRLTFTLSTHDAGGITASDLKLAREIERLAVESGMERDAR